MGLWQITMVILISITIGLIVGLILSYIIITQILRKPFYMNQKITQQYLFITQILRKPFYMKPQTIQQNTVETAPELIMSNLITEVKNNYMIATKTSSDKLLPFQNIVWKNAGWEEINKLPSTTRENLKKAYVDMHQANSIVRAEAEFGHRSYDLDVKYQKLRTNIATNLDIAKSFL